MAEVTLREITQENLRPVMDLSVGDDQDGLVAPNCVSIAQGCYEPKSWFRAIYADDNPVGFIMLFDDAEAPQFYLWRLMIDQNHQGKGYGREALTMTIDYVRSRPNATELLTSYVPKPGNPQPFYQRLGFVDAGYEDNGEIVLKLAL